ncbi:hypothetical protein DVK05_05920 [Halorubrum sp. Atlit-8R]|uniref:hypothetical protein n=1 Tax=unclassified Halorubrum TaxID=2642239 RepID=UPI000EF1EE28|nr:MULTISPECIES: hypothetical protein [unclassified Halorubrum]RLM66778.1 hypothetical protein DVK08_12945 [Halorubrum sp. Atlit-9R]RLM81599.1 hypothetical protein DVK05_05920 [Halorubrum sp. Atlit-8R]
MSEAELPVQTDDVDPWPPRLDDVRDLEAIVDALDEVPDVEEYNLEPDHREFTTHIVVRMGGDRPSTTDLSELYRAHDLRSTWAHIHPTGDLAFSIEAKLPEEVGDA